MKILSKTAILLVYCTLSVLAKGGGGGGKGGGGGASSGSSGGSRGSTGSTGSTGSSGSTGSKGSSSSSGRSSGTSTTTKGGSGSFSSSRPPPYSYSNTRSTYTSYPPSYGGGYSPASRYGYYGFYNPLLMYWFILPPFAFIGYNSYYHRYNSNDGYYYAPELTYQGSNTADVVINGTAYSGDNDGHNYRYSFNISTNNQFAMADHAFYTSSDPNAHPADFAYRLAFTHVVEFDDANQNGFYDSNEQIIALSSLQNLQWQPLIVSNLTVPTNQSQYYLETKTFANATYNSTAGSPTFGINLTWRVSNLQLNNTAPVIIQPNSLEYDFSLVNYPSSNTTGPNRRLAVAQLFSYPQDETINFDVNMTTPVNVANTIKTNTTYGISIGNYTQGRLEYQNTVNISDVTVGGNLDPKTLAGIPYSGAGDWIWGDDDASKRQSKLLFVTIPSTTNSSASNNNAISGFGFLDTDVMEAMASDGVRLMSGVLPVLLGIFMAFYLS